MLELNSGTSNPDIIDVKFEIVRLGRWQYGYSGFIHFKVDLYDDIKITATMERSQYRAGPYTMFPMGMEYQKLSDVMNLYYKPLVQPEALKCWDNPPIVEGKFKPHLAKRYIKITNCTIPTDNMPNILMEGYYKARLLLSGPVDVFSETLVLIETKIF